MSDTVPVTHAYPVEYVPKGGRATKRASVREVFPVEIRRLRAAEVPVALRMDRVLSPYPTYRDVPDLSGETWLRVGGGIARRLGGPQGPALGIEALAGVDPAGPGPEWDGFGYPYQAGPPEPQVVADVALLNPRRLVSDGAAASRAHLMRQAARTAVVDGALHVPGSEPVWGVRRPHGCGVVQVAACLSSDFRAGYTFAMFRADQLDRAVEVAESLAAEPDPAQPDRPRRVRVDGAIEVLDPSALEFDAFAFNADRIVRSAYAHPGLEGFARLPVPALRAWLEFREAAEAPGALHEAVAALARVREALPQEPVLVGRERHEQAAPALHRLLLGVPTMARLWEGDRQAAIREKDVEALSACIP